MELLGERLTDLARARLCQKRGECVNTVFANRRFTFHKRSQLFVGMHNKTLSVAAMCVCNPDRSPFTTLPLRRSSNSIRLC